MTVSSQFFAAGRSFFYVHLWRFTEKSRAVLCEQKYFWTNFRVCKIICQAAAYMTWASAENRIRNNWSETGIFQKMRTNWHFHDYALYCSESRLDTAKCAREVPLWEYIWIPTTGAFGKRYVLKDMWIKQGLSQLQINALTRSSISASAGRAASESRWPWKCPRRITAEAVISLICSGGWK